MPEKQDVKSVDRGDLMAMTINYAWLNKVKISIFTTSSNKLDGVIDNYDENAILLTLYEENGYGEKEQRKKTTVVDRYQVVSVGIPQGASAEFYQWLGLSQGSATENNES